VQNVDLETAEYLVGFLDRECTLSFQHMVKMGLGNSREAGQSAFGGYAAADPQAKFFNEAQLQIMECHGFSHKGLFLPEIGYRETSLELLV